MSESTSDPNSKLESFYPKNLNDFIMPKNTLLNDVKTNKAIDLIVSNLKLIPNWETYRADLEFLRIACTFIENMVKKADGLDKQAIIISVFVKLFNINESEINILKIAIDFLLNNKRIKKIKFIKKLYEYFKKNIKNFF
jgi:hypothetical protein